MLDVHPPHSPTHTWKDFFIHIATIVVGLLIAVGLEQSVEALHHRHQRLELEANLEVDGKLNRDWASQDLDTVRTLREWALTRAVQVEQTGATGPLALEPVALGRFNTPNFGVFLAARANGQMSLISTWQQNMQADLNRSVDQIFISDLSLNSRLRSAMGELNRLLISHAVPQPSGMLDVSSLTANERAQVFDRLLTVAEASRQLEVALVLYATENQLLLDNPEVPAGSHGFQREYDRIEKTISASHQGIDYTFTKH